MAESNLQLKRVWFDTAGAQAAIQKIALDNLTECAEQLVEIMKEEVMSNGNGSTFMRESAAAAVHHVLKEMSVDMMMYEVGIDENKISGMAEAFYTRVMVVLHGNQGGGPIWTKPGMETFSKGIVTKRTSKTHEPAKALPFFDQPDDRAGAMLENSLKKIQSIFDQCVANIQKEISGNFLSKFLHVG